VFVINSLFPKVLKKTLLQFKSVALGMAEKEASSTSSSLEGRSRSEGGEVQQVPDKRQRSDVVPSGVDDEESKMAWLAQAVSSNGLVSTK